MLVKDHMGLIWVGKGSYGLVKDLITEKVEECSFLHLQILYQPALMPNKLYK